MSELATLVARRLCHDLAGPAGAIATVVEMLGEGAGTGGPDPELQALLADSSATLLATLRLHRFVLGGGDSSNYQALFTGWAAAREGLGVRWLGAGELAPAAAALLLGLAMIAAEAAAGVATLTVAERAVVVTGTRLNLDPQIAASLAGAAATTSKSAIAALLYEAAAAQGRRFVVDAAPARLEIIVS